MKKFGILLCAIGILAGTQSLSAKATNKKEKVMSQEQRIKDLIAQMTLEEKVGQMMHHAPAIPRLNIPEYDWWSEALHGVARSGNATVFPQAIGLAATFDEDLAFRTADAISDEARAMYNANVKNGQHLRYSGLTFWSPNINIFRDPRWGRGQETYGEDPYLTGRMGLNFVKGLQGSDPDHLKVAACAKHFAVHSGPERLRHEFNAVVSKKDLFETYLPAFKTLVTEGHVEAVMCAYNRTNNEPCCGNKELLVDILRGAWGFKGHVVSDCWAISDIDKGHKFTKNPVESAALSLHKGVNLNCGSEYVPHLIEAVKQGLVQEKEIDASLAILLRTRFKLGMFDDEKKNPYASIPTSVVDSPEHRSLALESARKSIVLLKNNGVLPLKKNIGRLYVTGPNATSVDALLGNYYGINRRMVTILEGIAGHLEPGSLLPYTKGFLPDRPNVNPVDWTTGDAQTADATVVVMGLTYDLEGEEGESIASDHFGDRLEYDLPKNQVDFVKNLRKGSTKPIIVVITAGSPVNLTEISEAADAVLYAWYPGEEGGNAVADVLFGDISPSGRLPITFPKSLAQLPKYEEYSMKGRTYRYMEAEPLYPFGYGLSYTKFEYSDLKLPSGAVKKGSSVSAEVQVKNAGKVEGEEVVQLYVSRQSSKVTAPIYSLKGFKRVHLKPGESKPVQFTLSPEMMSLVGEDGKDSLESGKVRVFIGGSLPTARSLELGMAKPQEGSFTVE